MECDSRAREVKRLYDLAWKKFWRIRQTFIHSGYVLRREAITLTARQTLEPQINVSLLTSTRVSYITPQAGVMRSPRMQMNEYEKPAECVKG